MSDLKINMTAEVNIIPHAPFANWLDTFVLNGRLDIASLVEELENKNYTIVRLDIKAK